jgi:hypothetical protein
MVEAGELKGTVFGRSCHGGYISGADYFYPTIAPVVKQFPRRTINLRDFKMFLNHV